MPLTLTASFCGAVPGYVLGSMNAGSATLTITGTHSIRVGHTVIVELGGEAGAGARATVGVGGTWPATSFADEATLLATWTHPATTDGSSPAAYAQDTGNVFYWDGANIVQPLSQFYHHRKFWPRALVAVVDAVNGNTITLDTAATVATTDAHVWVDSLRYFSDGLHSPGAELVVPAGVYALSEWTPSFGSAIGTDAERSFVTVTGYGMGVSELYSPKGCQSLSLRFFGADTSGARDLTLRANVSHEAGLTGHQGYSTTYPRPVWFSNVVAPFLERVEAIGCEWGAFTFSGCVDGEMLDLRAEFTNARHYYLGIWSLQFDNCTRCHSYRCVVDSDWLCAAAEHFKSTDCTHNDLVLRNAQIASNSSVDSFYHGLEITIEASSARPADHDPLFANNSTVVIDWNKNTGSAAVPQGGGITGLVFRQTGDIGESFQFAWVFSKASTLAVGGNDITFEDATIETNGRFTQGSVSASLGPTQNINIARVVADARIDLDCGSIQDVTAPRMRYDPNTVTLGPNLNIPLMEPVL